MQTTDNNQSGCCAEFERKSPLSEKKKHIVRDYAESIIIAVILALFIKAFVVQAFKIPSASMENTMLIGDRLLVNKFIYGIKIPFTDKRILKIRDPRRGDVIVFEYPEDPSKDFIKRVIGTPGDVVQVINKNVYINGNLYINSHEIHKESTIIPEAQNPRDNTRLIKIPANSYFVMGDNRDRSYDSRFWGAVTNDKIEGLAFVKYWSWDSENHRVRWNRIGRRIM
jgi:signal peptidase I